MNVKVCSWLKSCVLLTVAMSATSALAQFQGQFNWPPTTNATPAVRIIDPLEGEVFLVGADIQVCADVDGFTNPVASVEFWAGTNSLGLVTRSLDHSDVYCLTVSNLMAGNYTLTAVATDTTGNSATSAGVDISVVTNLPPKVRLVEPRNGAVLLGPTNIAISASAFDPDGTVASVAFFEGTNSLGVVPTPPPLLVTNHFGVFTIKVPYSLTWSNVPAGTYALTAVATDNAGLSSTSAPVIITVLPPPQPKVEITNPRNGETFHNAPINIEVCAFEQYFTNPVVQMQFFAGSNSVGMTTNSPYSCVVWSNVPPGAYTLTATATDSHSVTATSAPVSITVTTNRTPSWYWGH